jgi:hypothetical protein
VAHVEAVVPGAFAGRAVSLHWPVPADAIVSVDGRLCDGIDANRRSVALVDRARGAERLEPSCEACLEGAHARAIGAVRAVHDALDLHDGNTYSSGTSRRRLAPDGGTRLLPAMAWKRADTLLVCSAPCGRVE